MTSISRKSSPFKRAVAFFGNQSALADAIGVSRQAVSFYDRRGWFPADRAILIARKMRVGQSEMLRAWRPKNGTRIPRISRRVFVER